MTMEMMRQALMWSSIINMVLFFISFLLFKLAHDWIYSYHGKWYNISVEKFDATYYAVMLFYKTSIVFFNIVPYLALNIIR